MKKRMGMIGLEVMIVIGFLSVAITFMFSVYNNINSTMTDVDVKTSFTNFVKSINDKRASSGFYPIQSTYDKISNITWNKENKYLNSVIGQMLMYKTIEKTKTSVSGTATGAVMVKMITGVSTKEQEKVLLDFLEKVCLNKIKDYPISKELIIPEITTSQLECVLYDNVKIKIED